MPDNHRTASARIALEAFRDLYGPVRTEDAITDLLCNLLHLARAEGLDPKILLARARRYYDRESLCPDC
jgi:hypothetical protein